MTKVVLDSNVYISALVFGGVPQKILDLIESQGLRLYVSQSIMDEVTGVLMKKFGWTEAEVEQFLSLLWQRSQPYCADHAAQDFERSGRTIASGNAPRQPRLPFWSPGTPSTFHRPIRRQRSSAPASSWNYWFTSPPSLRLDTLP